MAGDSGKGQLPDGMKLKGEENYAAWQESMTNLAVSHDLLRYIHAKGKAPKEVDEFSNRPIEFKELKQWKD